MARFPVSPFLAAHLIALFTIFIWGLTFISTKLLLADFTPLQILFIRFCLGWVALWFFAPRLYRFSSLKNEIIFALAGLSGVTAYFYCENLALTLTFAANAAVIVSTAPFFTAMLAWLGPARTQPGFFFFLGFILAIAGITLISFNGMRFQLNPLGDLLALLAAITWAFYSIFTQKLTTLGLGALLITRHIFFYGLIFMLPLLWLEDSVFDYGLLFKTDNLVNFLFLGIGASALCFASWTLVVKRLGAMQASIYIYLVPVVTVCASALLLDEHLTVLSCSGALLTILGLLASEMPLRSSGRKRF